MLLDLVSHSFFKIRPICEMVANCAVYCRAKQREEMFFAFSKGSRGCTGKKYVHRCYFSSVR